MEKQKVYLGFIMFLIIATIFIIGCNSNEKNTELPNDELIQNFSCPNMDSYSDIFTIFNGKISFDSDYFNFQKEKWINDANNMYGYSDDINIIYNLTCKELDFETCNIFLDSQSFKTNPNLSCTNLNNTYLCKEEKSVFNLNRNMTEAYSPYFRINNNYFLLIIQSINDEVFVKNTICSIPGLI